MTVLPAVVKVVFRRRAVLRPVHGVFAILLALCCVAQQPSYAQTADQRGEARVSIFADLTAASPIDQISFRIMNNSDPALLQRIAQTLGTKFGAAPVQLRLVNGDPDFPDDKSAAAEFYAPIVPRGEGYLPIKPYVEAFAPYATRVRIVYFVKGPFAYRGYVNPYASHDVTFTVEMPENITPQGAEPLAFYGVDVIIKNPALTAFPLANYPDETRKTTRTLVWRLALAAGVAIIIIMLGMLLALFLLRRQANKEKRETTAECEITTGGNHD
ncbi:MAG TPA: hypothetical protein VGL77_20035 [Armatimonadota bacterium]|jgi:hypothetical protein